jgi:hypothetical protein
MTRSTIHVSAGGVILLLASVLIAEANAGDWQVQLEAGRAAFDEGC